MRLNRHRLEQALFPVETRVEPRYGDLDGLGHVNNVAVGNILQEARVRFTALAELFVNADFQLVIAALTIEFSRDVHHPDAVYVSTGVLEVNSRSYRLGQLLRQNGAACVYAEVALVARRDNGAVELPEAARAGLQSLQIRSRL